MIQLSEKTKNIVSALITEVNDANKEYATEKVTSVEKKEAIKCSLDTANYRISREIKNTVYEVLTVLKEERINPAVYERIKSLFNERL
jgi:hypothetical protein